MKRLLLAVLALALTAPTVSFAQQRAPHAAPQNASYDRWCRDQGLDYGSVQICWAYTYEQCMASRTSQNETCYLNPRYDPRFRGN
ncbi:MAG: DUF3551 domain-containing protein [Xanthobacteraceae bacterium]|nr:DUF3551 domain-containing protein [Xanthobacteraceae bacterium]